MLSKVSRRCLRKRSARHGLWRSLRLRGSRESEIDSHHRLLVRHRSRCGAHAEGARLARAGNGAASRRSRDAAADRGCRCASPRTRRSGLDRDMRHHRARSDGRPARCHLQQRCLRSARRDRGSLARRPARTIRSQSLRHARPDAPYHSGHAPQWRGAHRAVFVRARVCLGAFRGAYCASKFALEALSDALRQEFAGSGIRVAIIEPGPIRSRFVETAVKRLASTSISRLRPPREIPRSHRHDGGGRQTGLQARTFGRQQASRPCARKPASAPALLCDRADVSRGRKPACAAARGNRILSHRNSNGGSNAARHVALAVARHSLPARR